jgi:hypothetical protein
LPPRLEDSMVVDADARTNGDTSAVAARMDAQQ